MSDQVKGPQSYFPSIEKKYGQPVDYWFGVLDDYKALPYMGMVDLLKNQQQLGHGHANALVAYYRSSRNL